LLQVVEGMCCLMFASLENVLSLGFVRLLENVLSLRKCLIS